jgi:TonB family protein
MKAYINFIIIMFLFFGCASTQQTVFEDINADSADLIPPSLDLLQSNPIITYREEEYYPEMAQQSGTEGDVILRAWITKTGFVRKVQIYSAENELFHNSALTAGLKYKFEPMIMDGNAIDSWVEFIIQYRLKK